MMVCFIWKQMETMLLSETVTVKPALYHITFGVFKTRRNPIIYFYGVYFGSVVTGHLYLVITLMSCCHHFLKGCNVFIYFMIYWTPRYVMFRVFDESFFVKGEIH